MVLKVTIPRLDMALAATWMDPQTSEIGENTDGSLGIWDAVLNVLLSPSPWPEAATKLPLSSRNVPTGPLSELS